ncbi:glycosyltransferase [Roseimarinus sediminis]|uniref:glycosyltransferase n=1 Tax=Roseimarinus sediminis TaxID=1610899 RepID=UPI003D1C9B19
MKIVILGPAHPYRGGIAALDERLARQLVNEGHEVKIVNFKLQYPGFLFPGSTQYTNAPAPKHIHISREINSVNPLNWIIRGLNIKKQAPDLIIVRFWLPFMGPSTGTICRLARQNKKTKVVAIVDNILPHEHRPGDQLFTKYFCKGVDGFLAMSQTVYKDLDLFIKKQPKRFSPHPIYDHYGEVISKTEAREQLGLDINGRYLLFFGFIRDYKGLDLLLSAMADPRIKEQQIKLLVAGEFYSDPQKYHQMIEQLGIADQVILHTDYISEHKVNLYFCACDLVTQPYKTATQSGVTQIGYHFNKPMLVTNVGGLPEIIEDKKCGYVVNPDPRAINEAIYDFYENSREEAMIAEVIKAKARFGWEQLTKTIFEIYSLVHQTK